MRQEFRATLSARDQKTNVEHHLSLPGGAERIRLRLAFPRGPGLGHMLCLSLFDGAGFRGSGHRGGALHEVRLSATEATPGYLPGAVRRERYASSSMRTGSPMGRLVPTGWMSSGKGIGSPCLPRTSNGPLRRDPASARTPGAVPAWYRGDLHSHTVHSDGDWTKRELLSAARKAGLDFIAVTDHNTVSHLFDDSTSDAGGGTLAATVGPDPLVIAGNGADDLPRPRPQPGYPSVDRLGSHARGGDRCHRSRPR